MKIKDLIIYLENCKTNYPISDEFQINYKQKRGGYLQNPNGKSENYNQKWHLTKSYLPTYSLEQDISEMYNRAFCPEMFLYLLEACGVEEDKLKEASKIAKNTIDKASNKRIRITATKEMRKLIPYEEFEKYFQKKMAR